MIKISNSKRSGILKVRLNSNASWKSLPDPSAITWSIQDLDSDSSGRNVKNGRMTRHRISRKRKLAISWNPLNSTDMSFVLKNIIGAENTGEFQCEYFDAEDGAMRTMTCYTGDRSAPVLARMSNGTYAFQSMSVDFIEC